MSHSSRAGDRGILSSQRMATSGDENYPPVSKPVFLSAECLEDFYETIYLL
ncbi:MAG: hypothetical protein KME12_23355 [Trichocoleus desertorum ATA4-8-CV12]|nr:hypothetical protein [Trichocoleus desertorum ATA4-8-CV12]